MSTLAAHRPRCTPASDYYDNRISHLISYANSTSCVLSLSPPPLPPCVSLSLSLSLSLPVSLPIGSVPKTAFHVRDRIPRCYIGKFPFGTRFARTEIPFNRNFGYTFNPSSVASPAPRIAPQTETPLSVTITTVGRKCAGEKTVSPSLPLSLSLSLSLSLPLSFYDRCGLEACDGRIQKSWHSRLNRR